MYFFLLQCVLFSESFEQLNTENKLKKLIDCNKELSKFSEIKPIDMGKKSASNSLLIFAKRDGINIFGKLFSNENELDVEGTIYNNHIKFLLNKSVTPHFVQPIDFFACTKSNQQEINNFKNFIHKNDQELFNQISQRLNWLGKKGPLSFIITHKTESNRKLLDYLINYITTFVKNNMDIKYDELNNVFFQIFYTLEALHRLGLYHGDLHINNIFIEDQPVKAYYVVDNIIFYMDSKVKVRIFDFDKSIVYKNLTHVNPHLFAIENGRIKANYEHIFEDKFYTDFTNPSLGEQIRQKQFQNQEGFLSNKELSKIKRFISFLTKIGSYLNDENITFLKLMTIFGKMISLEEKNDNIETFSLSPLQSH